MHTALEQLDRVLGWAVRKKYKHYALCPSEKSQHIVMQAPLLQQFANDHGYFSRPYPMVAHVSKGKEDTSQFLSLLRTFSQTTSPPAIPFVTLELLTKVLAYRDLTQGETIRIPSFFEERGLLHTFTVDRIFNLWQGMPAYGLIPKEEGISSLLLFRGTDFSPFSKRGFASLLSDLDPRGPGYFVFQRTRKVLRDWLQKALQVGKPARALGYSLGGSFAAYTHIYEHAWIDTENPSIAFNAPGIYRKTLEDIHGKNLNFVLYINRGDPISKVGKLFGRAYELSCNKILHPLAAHTLLLGGEESISMQEIDIDTENQTR